MSNLPETGYFRCSLDRYKNGKYEVVPDNDFLPLDIMLNAKELWKDEKEIILHVVIDAGTLTLLEQATGIKPRTREGMTAIGIASQYIGNTIDSVYDAYPELKPEISEEGEQIHKIMPHTWCGIPDKE